ncbi:glycosyltransferase [Acetobacter persici]|uniref:glycosyltransferase n=1 Tax=Acetobacter persici TaxID=1076596 RepID=UPI001F2A9884|nr:glycosyltransferase [Acetobacter persici]
MIVNYHLQVLGAVDNGEGYKDIELHNIDDDFTPIFVDKRKFFFNGNECFFSSYNRKILLTDHQEAFPIEANFCGENQFYLSINGGFVSSNTTSLFVQAFCREWEHFYLLDEENLRLLQSAFKNGFYTPGNNTYISSEKLERNHKHIKLDNYFFDLKSIISSKKIGANKLMLPREGLGLYIIELFKPLAYYSCFGNGEIISCMEESIYSLFTIGNFSGDIFIITDQEKIAFSEKLHRYLHRIHLQQANAYDFFDFTISRYMVYNLSIMDKYSPIMYIDCDIIINEDVNKIFHSAMATDKVLFSEEFKLDTASPWFGGVHWHEAGQDYKLIDSGINSGIFLFKSIEMAKEILFTVVQSMLHSQKIKLSREKGILETLDQPNLNYVLMSHFSNNFDVKILTQYVSHAANENFAIIPLVGFAHFNGGLGNFGSRVDLMRKYVEYLLPNSKVNLERFNESTIE